MVSNIVLIKFFCSLGDFNHFLDDNELQYGIIYGYHALRDRLNAGVSI